MVRIFSLLMLAFVVCAAPGPANAGSICGNGVVESGEQCDDGADNSDLRPDACRPDDCRKAYCGDGTIDTGEQCDDGMGNSDQAGLKCRMNCRMPRCGDGVVDTGDRTDLPRKTYSEQCDDMNTDDSDGCMKNCKTCVKLNEVGNIEITEDTHICPNDYEMDDYGDYGAIIIKQPGVTLNCHGASITGTGRGVGIMIFRVDNVTIKNCKLFGYESGIKGEDVHTVTLSQNHLCKNSKDIDLGDATGVGRHNACHSAGAWNDTGRQGCTRRLVMCNVPTATLPSQVKGPLTANPAIKVAPSQPPQKVVPQKVAPKTTAPVQQPVKPKLQAPSMKVFTPKTVKPVPPEEDGK